MAKLIDADLAIIGGGSGGLSVAAGAAQLGARVVLAEKGKMGGDCLNYGCVPSKALIAAGHAAQTIRDSARLGVNGHEPEIVFSQVHEHVHGVISTIAPNDSVERFRGLGVHVIEAPARFVDSRTIEAGGERIRARRIVVSTGSSPIVPAIDGIGDVAYHTNETIFDLTDAPEHLIVIGGGPIGLELAQAHRRLGSKVTVIEALKLLPKDDPDAANVVRDALIAEGVAIFEGSKVQSVRQTGNSVSIDFDCSGQQRSVRGSHLLIATGRRANIDGLNLDAAGIAFTSRGISVDARLRTTNRRVFAIGDVSGGYQFTHMAGNHAGIVIRNALFNLPAKVNETAVPWVTYTDPELAHVGLTESAARDRHAVAQATCWPFHDNDRAQAECAAEGFVKMVTGRRGRVLGATIVGRHAGELIMPWVLAIQKGLTAKDMASFIAPYPTLSEASKRAAGAYFTPSLFSERTRRLVRLMQRLP